MAIADNTTALRNLLALANGLPSASSGPAYGKAVFFGDSISMGTNNNDYSFVDVLSESGLFESVTKRAYGGATIGPYSGNNTTNNYCLVNQVTRYASDIQSADIIFLEYGGNDIGAVEAGRVNIGFATDGESETSMCGYLKKAMNAIRNLNSKARIVWIAFARWHDGPQTNERDGTSTDMLMYYEVSLYRLLKDYGCNIVDMGAGFDWSAYQISESDIHPTTEGHMQIAQNVISNMFIEESVRYPHKTVVFNVSEGYATVTVSDIVSIVWGFLYSGGVDVNAVAHFPGLGDLKLRCCAYSSSQITFMGDMNDEIGIRTFIFKWTSDGATYSVFTHSTS